MYGRTIVIKLAGKHRFQTSKKFLYYDHLILRPLAIKTT